MKAFFFTFLIIAVLLGGGYWLGNKLAAESRAESVRSSLEDMKLGACPTAPNCVSSDAQPTDFHFVLPINDPGGTRWAKLIATVESMDGATLVLSTDNYVYFTFTTKYFGFVDDVEFYHRPREELIAVRSASRVLKADLGYNRRRIEAIRIALGL